MIKPLFALVISLFLVSCGGSGGSGSAGSGKTDEQKSSIKTNRPALIINDVNVNYVPGAEVDVVVNNRFGDVGFSLANESVVDVVTITNNKILILNPGRAEIVATDVSDEYQTSEVRFYIDVAAATNNELNADPVKFALGQADIPRISVRGQRGNLSYEIEEGSRHLLDVGATGELTPLGQPGRAYVLVRDAGTRRYLPASVRVSVDIEPIPVTGLSYANLSLVFAEGKTLLPQRLSGDRQANYHFAVNPSAEQGVIELNPQSGEITLLNVGYAAVDVTADYGPAFSQSRQAASFTVNVAQGVRKAPLAVADLQAVYADGRLLQPDVEHALAAITYQVVQGNSITIDRVSGLPAVQGVGSSVVEALDFRDERFPAATARFTVDVSQAPHPGLAAEDITLDYRPGLSLLPSFSGVQGGLIFSSDDDAVAKVISGRVYIQGTGVAHVSAADDGGELYGAAQQQLLLTVRPGEHPLMQVTPLVMEYADSCISLAGQIQGNRGALQLLSSSNEAIARVDSARQCLQILAAGSTQVSVKVSASALYRESSPITVPVRIENAGSRLRVTGTVEATYGGAVLQPPAVSGTVGVVRYRIADGAARQVVSIDEQSGAMTILGAGFTRILVTDSGSDSVSPGEAEFDVQIAPAINTSAVSYASAVYQENLSLYPLISGVDEMNYHFELRSGSQVVQLLDNSTGELKVLAAGAFQLDITASSANYQSRVLEVGGNVERAPHPGLPESLIEFNYVPGQIVALPLPAAIGERNISLLGGQSGDLFRVTEQGELEFLDYAASPVSLVVQESGNANYLPLDPTTVRVRINAPLAGYSDLDMTLDKATTLISSSLNSADNLYLKDSRMVIAGYDRELIPSSEDITAYGEGRKLVVWMLREGDGLRRPVIVYVTRLDGCSAEYNLSGLADATPVAADAAGYCIGGDTGRYTIIRIIDEHNLSTGVWNAEQPLTIDRRAERYFVPSTSGGVYVSDPATTYVSDATGPARKIYEWNRIGIQRTVE